MSKLYLGLVHYPVLNKLGKRIMTSVTNLDIHDIARLAACYNCRGYYLITPDSQQQTLIEKICLHWKTNEGLMYNPDRSRALALVRTADSIETVTDLITSQEGLRPIVVTTTARILPAQMTYGKLSLAASGTRPVLLLFGTGYGLCDEIHEQADYILSPIKGTGAYRHLSVRSAVAIVLDRISSEKIDGRNHGYSATSWQRPNQNRLSRLSRRRYGQGPL
ncbi:MAG TPA: RNA methyltransferase [Candidatus Cloacimonadota bacterium]|nr:RNA methyltransferase [Candidatus Cloacimonadota bacterium]HPS38996.1 RNA methyltransferase [Candidatus Cloacimonadota bacterium]